MKKLGIIIVNYNVSYFLEQVLKSVYSSVVDFDFEVWVVDNNSVDDSVQMVQDKFSQVNVIANDFNAGFSKANNQAIDRCNAEYVLLLNPDTVIEENTLQKCADYLDENQNVGALGAKMVDGTGTFLPESKRGLPTPSVAFYKIFGLSSMFPKSRRFGKYHLQYLDENEINEVDVLAGAFMFIRNSVYKEVGGLDNDYFMYGEDIDLSYKIQKAGYKNIYFPETRIIHYKGESTKRTSVNYVFVFYNAMIIFAKKHFHPKRAKLFTLLINLAIYLKAGIQITRNVLSHSLLTLFDGLFLVLGLVLLSNFWEQNFKVSEGDFPIEYKQYVLPVYAFVWLVSNYLSGGNDEPYRFGRIIRGALFGVFFISAVSNFLDLYRYSKAIIVLGGGVSTAVFIFTRMIKNLILDKSFVLEKERNKRIALVGNEEEVTRVRNLIYKIDEGLNYIGFVTTKKEQRSAHKDSLGSLDQLDQVIEIYDVEELVFCSKDITSTEIIDRMVSLGQKSVEFKIVPDESHYIIGSSSKNTAGDYYTADVKWNLSMPEHRRNKRLIDLSLSLFVLSLFPVLAVVNTSVFGLLKNTVSVLFGRKSWVGFSSSLPLSSVKEGVLGVVDVRKAELLDNDALRRLDILYAKDYNYKLDLEIFFKRMTSLVK